MLPDMKRKSPSADDLENLPSRRRIDVYLDKYANLQTSLKSHGLDHLGKIKSYDNFTKKYLAPPSLWNLRRRWAPMTYDSYKTITKKGLSDFYSQTFFYEDLEIAEFKEKFEQEEKPFDRLMEWQYWNKMTDDCIAEAGIKDVEPMLKEALKFPHSQLQEVCWYYEEFSGTAMTDELRHQLLENKRLYKKIKGINAESIEDWFKAVIETKDLRYIIQNVEARIAADVHGQMVQNDLNSKLWELYIGYLLREDHLLAEEVYYRFRRIFLSNRKFATEFPHFRGKLSPEAKEAMEKMKYNAPTTFLQLPFAPLTIYTNPAWIKQVYPFRESLVHYIIANASDKTTRKLYQSCKQFYFLKRKPLCHSLYIGKDYKLQYFRDSLATTGECSEFLNMDKFILMNTLIVQHSENTNLLHEIYPKITACTLRFLRLTNQTFYVNEYNFLSEAGTIMKLVFQKVSIIDENDQPIILEEFLQNLPQAMYIDAPIATRVTRATSDFLFNWEKPQKIHCISILLGDELMEILKPLELFRFLKRLVVNVQKSTNVVQFEKGNPNISAYLQDLVVSTHLWEDEFGDKPPKVLTLKDYQHLL